MSSLSVTSAKTLRTIRRVAVPRGEAFRWVAGAYFLLLGMSLLLLPQELLTSWFGLIWLRGVCTALAGLVMLWIAGTALSRRNALILSFVAIAPQLLFGIHYLQAGMIQTGVTLTLLAVASLLLPLAPPIQPNDGWRPDALGLVFGSIQAIQGLDLLFRSSAGVSIPAALGLSPAIVGSIFVLGGSGVVLTQLIPGLPGWLRWLTHLFAGGALLGLWAAQSAFNAPIYWALGAASVLRGASIAILPWWSERAARLDNQALKVRLALALITASLLPILLALPVVQMLIEQRTAAPVAENVRARQIAFGIALLVALGAGGAGWWLAGQLAAPITALVRGVRRIAEGKRDAVLPSHRSTELAALSSAVASMAAALDARIAEREQLITKLQAQNEELQTLEAQREEYIRAISHDLRNPLAALYGNAQRLQRGLAKSGMEKEALIAERMIGLGNRMNSMLQDLVDSMRFEDNPVQLKCEPVDLLPFLKEVRERMGDAEEINRIELPQDSILPPVWADRNQLERILANLLSNAIKYSPAVSPVRVTVCHTGRTVTVSIQDWGDGIKPEDQQRLFTRYYRTSEAQAHQSGLGLGLYITRALVEAHGGTIWVESQPGAGATFSFTLPVTAQSTHAAH